MRFVILDFDALILLGVQPDFFLSSFVLKAQRVRGVRETLIYSARRSSQT